MAEAFAGFVCGYALALVLAPVAAIALVRARVRSEWLSRVLPEGTSLVALSVVLHLFGLLTLTALGLVLGLALAGLEDRSPEGGLGSPNAAFTALVLAIAAIAVLPMAIVARQARGALLAAGLVFAATFGWIMPYLAELRGN